MGRLRLTGADDAACLGRGSGTHRWTQCFMSDQPRFPPLLAPQPVVTVLYSQNPWAVDRRFSVRKVPLSQRTHSPCVRAVAPMIRESRLREKSRPITSTYVPILGAWCKRMGYGAYTLHKALMRGRSLYALSALTASWPRACCRGCLPPAPRHLRYTCTSTPRYGTVLGGTCRRDHRPGKILASVFRTVLGRDVSEARSAAGAL